MASNANAEKVSYDLRFCENENVLNKPKNEMVKSLAGMTLPAILANQRTKPIFKLTNTSTSDGLLTTFTMSIGDLSKNFKGIKILDSNGVGKIVKGIVQNGNEITMTFKNFNSGDSVRFQVVLGSKSKKGSQYPDYRKTFFTPNGGSNTNKNSLVRVGFKEEGFEDTLLTKRLPNYAVAGNLNAISLGCGCNKANSIESFLLRDSGDPIPDVPVVPEPSSIALGLSAAVGFGLYGLRRRRQSAAA